MKAASFIPRSGARSICLRLFLLLDFSLVALSAQPLSLEWLRFGGPIRPNDYTGLAIDPAGNPILSFALDTSFNVGTGQIPYSPGAMAKYNPFGFLVWTKELSGMPFGSVADSADFVHVCGASFGASASHYTMFVTSHSSSGEPLWIAQGVGPAGSTAIAFDVVTDPNRNSYVFGSYEKSLTIGSTTLTDPIGGITGFVASFSPDGLLRWAKSIGTIAGACKPSSIEILGDDLFIAGQYWNGAIAFDELFLPASPSGSGNVFLARLSLENGAAEWAQAVANVIEIPSLVATPAGPCLAFLVKNNGGFIRQYSGTGAIAWEEPLPQGPEHYNLPRFITTDQAGSLYLVSLLQNPDAITVRKYTPAGDFLWQHTLSPVPSVLNIGAAAATLPDTVYLAGFFLGDSETDFAGHPASWSSKPEFNFFLGKISPEPPATAPIAEVIGQTTFHAGVPAVLEARVTGSSPYYYQWIHNGVEIPGATNSILSFPNPNASSAGEYSVRIVNPWGFVLSEPLHIFFQPALAVLVTTVAGTNESGYVNSANPLLARFNQPNSPAHLDGGLVAIADAHNHVIRLMNSAHSVGALAGHNVPGYVDGPAAAARFRFPLAVARDINGDVLVADTRNYVIRRIAAFGLRHVSTIAGSTNIGYKDGPALQAEFNYPNDLVVDAHGNIFVTEFLNHTIRKISTDGMVSTFAGNGTPGSEDGLGTQARFNQPGGIAIDPAGNLYLTEWSGHRIRKISPSRQVTTLAGSGQPGFQDGPGTLAQLDTPDAITLDPEGNIYFTEAGNHSVRKLDPHGNVTTIAGLGTPGFQDGDRSTASFNGPTGIIWHPSGSLYVTDVNNHSIRRIEFLDADTDTQTALAVTLNASVTIFGQSGDQYLLQGAEAGLEPIEWITLDTIFLTNSAQIWIDPHPAVRSKRFYRALRLD